MKIDGNEYTEDEIIELLRIQKIQINQLTEKVKDKKIINIHAMTEHEFDTYLFNMPIWIESMYKIFDFFMKNSNDEKEKAIVWIEYRAFFSFLKNIMNREEITKIAFGKNDE